MSAAAANTMVALRCEQCERPFERPRFQHRRDMKRGSHTYCSPACRNRALQQRVKITCAECGKKRLITLSAWQKAAGGAHFCSPACSNRYHGRRRALINRLGRMDNLARCEAVAEYQQQLEDLMTVF